MINLQVVRPHWIKDEGDDPEDLCAHGHVELIVNGDTFLDGTAEQSFTLSAAGLFLLRTVEKDHLPEDRVTHDNYLFPCCGFNAWPAGDNGELVIFGCNIGTEVWVRHLSHDEIELTLDKKTALVSRSEWTQAVVHFADQVKDFYARSLPKVEIKDDFDKQGWDMLWSEFDLLLEKHRLVV